MKYTQQLALIGLLISLLIVGCSPSSGGTGEPSGLPETITCEVFYRHLPGESLSGQTITLAGDGNRERVEFEDLTFSAQYSGDEFEGWSLFISVTMAEGDEQIVGQLYQLDREQGLRNQYLGGHGFTGLGYVYHPSSTGELQYFCAAS